MTNKWPYPSHPPQQPIGSVCRLQRICWGQIRLDKSQQSTKRYRNNIIIIKTKILCHTVEMITAVCETDVGSKIFYINIHRVIGIVRFFQYFCRAKLWSSYIILCMRCTWKHRLRYRVSGLSFFFSTNGALVTYYNININARILSIYKIYDDNTRTYLYIYTYMMYICLSISRYKKVRINVKRVF